MTSQRIHSLRYAVRPRVVLKYVGLLATMLGLLTLAPLVPALWMRDWTMAVPLAVTVVLLVSGGIPLARMTAPSRVQVNEALTVVVLTFLIGSAAMVWPFAAAGVAPLDAWFEAVSGITTTGLTTLATVEDKPLTFLFARAWMQWYGGLGIVVLSVGLLLRHSAASRRLVVADVTSDTLVSTTRMHAQRVLLAYVALTALGLAVIWAATGNWLVALLHTLSAVSTGGFSMYDDNLRGLGSPLAASVVMAVAWCGAVSLPLYYSIWVRGWKPFVHDSELHVLVIATLAVIASITVLFYWQGKGFSLVDSVILGATAQSGTGFSTTGVASLTAAVKLVLIASMFVGGCVGSTSGGIKILRMMILWRLLQISIQRTGAPQHAVMEPRLAGKRLAEQEGTRALLLIVLFAALIGLSWFVFLLYGYDPLDAFFEVVSASATVGLSTGISRPELEPLLKGILCFDMLAGRLEIMALLVVLYTGSLFGKRQMEST